MATTNVPRPLQRPPGVPVLAWAVLAAAVLQVVAPLVTFGATGGTPGTDSGADLLISPVGWAFAIWGVIYTLAIAQAIAVLVRGAHEVSRRQQIGLIVLYLGGTLWIGMSETGNSLATAAALLVMLIAAVDAVLTVADESIAPRWLSVLTRAAVGLYAGWVTAAFFLNVSTALVDFGPVEVDELAWQIVVLVLAVVALVAITVRTRGILTYAAAGAWALVGIAVTGRSDGTTAVTVLALVAIVLVVVAAAAARLAGRRAAAPV
ncbi:hypothetical protein [Aeromicrobium sp. CF3.5]|uniref:hypothetical protein n=1 Tax=Aeromicrobium sp. CF3.5 TaxID=3373078 RepID=UPI003EE6F6B2